METATTRLSAPKNLFMTKSRSQVKLFFAFIRLFVYLFICLFMWCVFFTYLFLSLVTLLCPVNGCREETVPGHPLGIVDLGMV